MPEIAFADTVLVLSSPETEAAGIAGKTGTVYGLTAPSNTGVVVVGELLRDFAINVFFEELDQDFWLAEELLEFVDYGAGVTISLDGVDKTWARASDGSWMETRPTKPD